MILSSLFLLVATLTAAKGNEKQLDSTKRNQLPIVHMWMLTGNWMENLENELKNSVQTLQKVRLGLRAVGNFGVVIINTGDHIPQSPQRILRGEVRIFSESGAGMDLVQNSETSSNELGKLALHSHSFTLNMGQIHPR